MGISRARLEEGTYTEYDRVFLLLDQEDVYQGKEEALPPELVSYTHLFPLRGC